MARSFSALTSTVRLHLEPDGIPALSLLLPSAICRTASWYAFTRRSWPRTIHRHSCHIVGQCCFSAHSIVTSYLSAVTAKYNRPVRCLHPFEIIEPNLDRYPSTPSIKAFPPPDCSFGSPSLAQPSSRIRPSRSSQR